jgi:uncharacterized BrkB/YihY/UPF0761 family membrane protein
VSHYAYVTMDDFPAKIADALETFATKVRAMTVDRIANAVRWVAAGVVILTLVAVVLVLSIIGLFRVLDTAMDPEVAYAVLGGLFALLGVLVWRKRIPKETREDAQNG